MKKYLIFLCLCAVIFPDSLKAGNVEAYLTHATFNLPSQKPYLETYMSVIGNSLRFVKNSNGKFQAAVDISISFLQNDTIRNAQKYTLNSPETDDTTKALPNFVDQQRFNLANGSYIMQISISDKNKVNANPFSAKIPVKIDFPSNMVTISDIQLLESYTKSVNPGMLTKSGYDLFPYVSTFYPENINKVKFYAEIYNAKTIIGDGQKMLVSYFIESYEKRTKLSEYSGFSKQISNDVNIVLAEFNINNLPSGNYNLVIEIRDKENKIQADQRCFLQRMNKVASLSLEDLTSIDISKTFAANYKSGDTLSEYIRSLRPISSPNEIQYAENQLKGKKLETMQQFFYNFWRTRDAVNTEISWLDYFKEVQKVNNEFGTYGLKGYDTDRGRVYLQYGPPDSRNKVDNEPSAYPYEIWQYNSIFDKAQMINNPNNKQSNKRFVFYNPDLVTNKYSLIHSDARGEIYNSRWELQLHKRDTQSGNFDLEKAPGHYGGNADDNFRNPK
ncbi:MAG: GWxTD domain-containing protein [Bacteroidota bacterium]|nr:GWxTD domain-containing protein [Bacteroidota bacterium]